MSPCLVELTSKSADDDFGATLPSRGRKFLKPISFYPEVNIMPKLRPKHVIEEYEKSKVVYTPCGFCCTMMEVPKKIIESGSLWSCKKCGYKIKFRKQKINVATTEREHKYHERAHSWKL